jgi:hypothetical protein
MRIDHRHRIAALVVAIVVALSLAGVGWWVLQDGNDANNWLVSAIRVVDRVILSKSGLNGFLLAIVAVGAGAAWIRSRRGHDERAVTTEPDNER